jgi:hypothetical protein
MFSHQLATLQNSSIHVFGVILPARDAGDWVTVEARILLSWGFYSKEEGKKGRPGSP